LRRRARLRDRRRRARPHAALHVDPASSRGTDGLMAIAVERRAQVGAPRRDRRRAQRGVAHLLTYLGLLVALVFFLGPFFWIVTTSLKGNEDFSPSRPCGSPPSRRSRTMRRSSPVRAEPAT